MEISATQNEIPLKNFGWLDIPKSIWYFLGPDKAKWAFFNITLFSVFFYDFVPPMLVGRMIDFFTNYHAGDSLRIFYYYAIFLGVAHAIISLIRLTCKGRLSRIGISAKTRARIQGFDNLINLPLHWHAKENTGNKIERVFTGSQAIREWSFFSGNSVFPITVSFVGVLTIFLFLNPTFFIFMVVYEMFFYLTQRYYNGRIAEMNDQFNKSNQAASGSYMESTGNLLSIKAMGSEKNISKRVKETEETAQDLQHIISDLGIQKWKSFQVLNGFAFTVFFILISRQMLIGAMTVGSILVYYTYFSKLRDASYDANDATTKAIGLKSDLANMMPIFLEETGVRSGTQKFPKKWDKIEIVDGSFAYPSGHKALDKINLTLSKNEKLGVAGASGSGKSTLVKILLGLYELESGQFRVGDKNYYDIIHEDLIKNIAVVLQETELFNLSLRDNITGLKNVDPDLLDKAIEVSQLGAVLKKLPDGLNTLVGEKGYKLSGGERQRLGIARAVCK
ncbi:MAG: ABC transporter ATP-binding protein, partial [Candidatus Vogelbacteria bacterium]|nr:ABC transporter ATP-binding protein [Candidatus Vogelbacteria bacterium]